VRAIGFAPADDCALIGRPSPRPSASTGLTVIYWPSAARDWKCPCGRRQDSGLGAPAAMNVSACAGARQPVAGLQVGASATTTVVVGRGNTSGQQVGVLRSIRANRPRSSGAAAANSVSSALPTACECRSSSRPTGRVTSRSAVAATPPVRAGTANRLAANGSRADRCRAWRALVHTHTPPDWIELKREQPFVFSAAAANEDSRPAMLSVGSCG
jgi:hypothetical protein